MGNKKDKNSFRFLFKRGRVFGLNPGDPFSSLKAENKQKTLSIKIDEPIPVFFEARKADQFTLLIALAAFIFAFVSLLLILFQPKNETQPVILLEQTLALIVLLKTPHPELLQRKNSTLENENTKGETIKNVFETR